jgi:hypothetical protein
VSGKKVKTGLFSLGLALVVGAAASDSASAQDMFWGFRPMPWQTYYSGPVYYSAPACSSGSCNTPAWTPTCPGGSCAPRVRPQGPAVGAPVTNSVQPTYQTARPTFQPQPSVTQSRVTPANANRESPYYEYREVPSKSAPTRVGTQLPVTPARNDDSPYYP